MLKNGGGGVTLSISFTAVIVNISSMLHLPALKDAVEPPWQAGNRHTAGAAFLWVLLSWALRLCGVFSAKSCQEPVVCYRSVECSGLRWDSTVHKFVHLLWPPGRCTDVIWVPKSLLSFLHWHHFLPFRIKIVSVQGRSIYVNKEIWSWLGFECRNLYVSPSLSTHLDTYRWAFLKHPLPTPRACTSLTPSFQEQDTPLSIHFMTTKWIARFGFQSLFSKIHDTSLTIFASILERITC